MNLPKFLYRHAIKHNTSLGENAAFPPEEEDIFELKILKNRFEEVTKRLNELNLESTNENFLIKHVSELMIECIKLEKPLRSQLESLCKKCIINMLQIPEETLIIECKLVDKVQPNEMVRILPEKSNKRKFKFEDLNDFSNANKVILKRRLINSLIQGAAYDLTINCNEYITEIYRLNSQLLDLYKRIIIINDYLLFIKNIKIDENNINHSAYVATYLGQHGEKSIIQSQSILFPYLMIETIRGCFELFASHGLPSDRYKANYILSQADFLLAEPWDIRLGVNLWKIINNDIQDTKLLPFIFSNLCELKVDNFNKILQEIFANTNKGEIYLKRLINISKKEYEVLSQNSEIEKTTDNNLITDEYLTVDELNNFVIEENYD